MIAANKVVYTDHYSLLLKFKDLPMMRSFSRNAPNQATRWNTNREGGWATYEHLTTYNKILDEVQNMINEDTNKIEKVIIKC